MLITIKDQIARTLGMNFHRFSSPKLLWKFRLHVVNWKKWKISPKIFQGGNKKFTEIIADLPTPNTCKSEGFEKKAQKNLEIRTSNLEKPTSNKKNHRLFVSEYCLPY